MPLHHSSSSRPSGKTATEPLPRRVQVLLPLPLDRAYDYLDALDTPLGEGDFVRVPFAGRERTGCVWSCDPVCNEVVDEKKLKHVIARRNAPPLPAPMARFINWAAAYTCAPIGSVLRMAMSVPQALDPPAEMTGYVRSTKTAPESLRMTAARTRVLDVAGGDIPLEAAELARRAGTGISVVRRLAKAGALTRMTCVPSSPFAVPDANRAGPSLSADQEEAAASLRRKVNTGGFSVTLLDGVTGSGKTEVYFEAVAAALKGDKQILVLVPEIPLAGQWLERFTERFSVAPAIWHSDLAQGKRRAAWRAVVDHGAHVVVGARSTLFLPFPDLGLIIVDEEHEAAYKQEEGVIYHARDMAVVRGREAACPVVLASATPSLETTVNVEEGRYNRVHLPDRHGGAVMPHVTAIDMRSEGPETGQWLSPTLRRALAATFAGGEQAMLFLNRRGYAPLTLCRTCGHRFSCPNCTAWLVTHRAPEGLVCHHCGYHLPPPESCPKCSTEDTLAACGPGVERLAEEAGDLFPNRRLAVMASDMPGGAQAAAEVLIRVRNCEIDLLIGTQIIAKGHHFPGLTLVGVVDADLGLAGGDLRAGERTFQLLHQVAGRAGRESRPGKVYLQTYMPEHPVMGALVSGDRDAFFEAEAEQRRAFALPPFGRLAAVIVSGRDAGTVEATARRLRRAAPQVKGVEILGPAPAPLTVLHGRARWRLLLKAPRRVNVPGLMKTWLGAVKIPGGVRARIDIDPYSFL